MPGLCPALPKGCLVEASQGSSFTDGDFKVWGGGVGRGVFRLRQLSTGPNPCADIYIQKRQQATWKADFEFHRLDKL